jgi:predicted GIY-YIG superfamily endonuclease
MSENASTMNSVRDTPEDRSKNLYVLELRDEKFYVGLTHKRVSERYQEHAQGRHNAAAWTRLYPPVRILEAYKVKDSFEEDSKVKRLMNKYGIDRVRGGSYTNIQLSQTDHELLQRELKGANGLCYRCGSSCHYAKECSRTIHFFPYVIGYRNRIC